MSYEEKCPKWGVWFGSGSEDSRTKIPTTSWRLGRKKQPNSSEWWPRSPRRCLGQEASSLLCRYHWGRAAPLEMCRRDRMPSEMSISNCSVFIMGKDLTNGEFRLITFSLEK